MKKKSSKNHKDHQVWLDKDVIDLAKERAKQDNRSLKATIRLAIQAYCLVGDR